MNRNKIVALYRQRIESGERIKLSSEERSFLVQDFVQKLQGINDPIAIREMCRDEITLLEEGYGRGSNSTTSYLSRYRSAITQAVEQGILLLTEKTTARFVGHKQGTGEAFEATNHLAWSLMRYDNAVYARNRRATNVGNNRRQDDPQPFVPDRFLEKARELLAATEAETLAVGIAALTGRRHTEVAVSGQFTLTKHPYLLAFDGQLKKDTPVAYPIVSLIPAEAVMEAIDRFRTMPQVRELQGLTSVDQLVVNFRARVNSRVKLHFQKTGILPLLPGFQSVSIHRLRAAYARLAIYFWLPNQGMNEQRFLQFYLGHVEASQMDDAPNSNATTHYFGYRLVDESGKPISASGIKLMSYPPLPSPSLQQVEEQLQFNEVLKAMAPDGGEENQSMNVPDTGVEETGEREKGEAMLPNPAIVDNLPAKPETPAKNRYKEVTVNLNTLLTAADALGLHLLKGKGKGYQLLLQQVLEAIGKRRHNQSLRREENQEEEISGRALVQDGEDRDKLVQKMDELSQQMTVLSQHVQNTQVEHESVSLLANEVTSLRKQLQQLIEERDSLQSQVERLLPLQQEGQRLKQELQLARDHLNQFLHLARGAASEMAPDSQIPEGSLSQSNDIPKNGLTARDEGTFKSKTHDVSAKLSPDDRIPIAIDALIRFNQSCSDIAERWFISTNVIAMASATNPATKVKPWLELHPEVARLVQQHNQAMETDRPHHNRGKDKTELRSIVDAFTEGSQAQHQ